MHFSDLKHVPGGKLHLYSDVQISRFSVDTRNLTGSQGEVFVAIQGKRDGHDYIQNALEKGVKNFIVSKELQHDGVNVLIVEDTLKAFQSIAQDHRSKFDIPVLAITGSNGKTTVKEWVSTILAERFFVVKSPKSYNSQIGVPLSLLEMKKNHEIGIFEAGISRVGEMKSLQKMILPSFGIFTNLGEAHADGFDSRSNKLAEKLELFKESEWVVCQKDTPYYAEIASSLGAKVITWSFENGDYRVTWENGSVLIDDDVFQTTFSSDTQLENLTHCIIAAKKLGLSKQEIQQGVDLVEGVPMRLELKKGVNGCYLLDDTYNNDEVGLQVALDYLESHKQNEKRTLILSDILHSGKTDEMLYRDIAQVLKSKEISRIIGVGPRIFANSNAFSMPGQFFESTEELLQKLPEFRDEMILIKGARNFELERVAQRLQERSHGTVLEVNFEALQHNLNEYRKLLQPKTRLMVMVKANAYGSGLLEVANFLQHQQVDMLGVAYVDEAIQLRKNGVTIPIMIMNPYIESFEQFERYDLQAEIFSLSHFRRMLRDTTKHPKVHLEIDTGMHRLGFSPDELEDLIQLLKSNPEVIVEGIFTHFSSAEHATEDEFTEKQVQQFEVAYAKLSEALGYKPTKHAGNSSGIVRWPQYHFDMVRLGIGLYGFDPTGQMNLRFPSQLKTVISQVQNLRSGETVGYSRNGKVLKDSQVAILPIGYEDGYSRIFGNGNAMVSVNGKLCPTIGNVCMDMIMVDVTGLDAKEGDEVVIFGSEPTINDLADWGGTMPYEILTNVSSRVKRVFVSE